MKREISRQVENKIQDTEYTGAAINYLIDDGDVRSLLPALSQGITQQGRLGNRVRLKSMKMKMHLSCFNQAGSTAPVYFDIYIFKFKPANFGGGPPAAADMLLFLQDGSNAVQYNGTNVLTGLRKVNNDYFTHCIKRRIPLFNAQNTTSQIASTSNYNPAATLYFDLTPHVKKLLIYDDAASSVQNDNLYIAVGGTMTDQSSLTTVNLGQYSLLVETVYEDA